jgi:hypothetical protein
MNEKLDRQIKAFKEIGIQYTFDGYAAADLLTMLDDAADVRDVDFTNSRLTALVGDAKVNKKQTLSLIAQASLLGAITAGTDEVEGGTKLWFEWMLPKDFYYEKKV